MRDDTTKWAIPTDGIKTEIADDHVRVQHIASPKQTLISGPRSAALEFCGMPQARGWPDAAEGVGYAISLRRDRILLVGGQVTEWGWQDDAGLAVSDVSAGYAVLAISGHSALHLLRTGTELSLGAPSASAQRLWNGFDVILYRYEGVDSYRLHVGSAYFEALWEMMERQTKLIAQHRQR